MAGNLQLAGQIAVTALQLLFQQGIDAIAELLGGTLGAAIGDIGTRLIRATSKARGIAPWPGMAAMWAAFSSGSWKSFRRGRECRTGGLAERHQQNFGHAARYFRWRRSAWAKLLSKILGVDVAEEKRKSEEFDRKRGLAPQDALGDAKNAAREQLAGQAAAGQDIRRAACASRPKNAEEAIGNQHARLGRPEGSDRERELQNRILTAR
jgi:hypothetical protein